MLREHSGNKVDTPHGVEAPHTGGVRYPDRYAAILLSGRAYQALEALADEQHRRAVDVARDILERVLLEPKGPKRLRILRHNDETPATPTKAAAGAPGTGGVPDASYISQTSPLPGATTSPCARGCGAHTATIRARARGAG
jgi:hypothetical protein